MRIFKHGGDVRARVAVTPFASLYFKDGRLNLEMGRGLPRLRKGKPRAWTIITSGRSIFLPH